MKAFTLLLFILFIQSTFAQTKTELERINFFPNANGYLLAGYQYSVLEIETPQSTVMTKEVSNYYDLITLTYAHKISRWLFLGITGKYEQASENGVRYGLQTLKRFESVGPNEPEIFAIYRLRPQREGKGMIDLTLAYSPPLGTKEVGSHGNRLNGREVLSTGLSHGLWEEEWEFRTSFDLNYYDEGREENTFTNATYDLESYYDLTLGFKAQYRINPWLFAHGSIGFNYQSTQDIVGSTGETRELQAGSGSVFNIGLKKPLNNWSLLEFNYSHKRNEYFVKGESINLDGHELIQKFSLNLLYAF